MNGWATAGCLGEGKKLMVTVADYLAGLLREGGVTHVFGLPGGENVPVIEA